jgi:hypothetical protein
MTAHSRNAEIEDLSADCRWLAWGLKFGNQARRSGRRALLAACLMAGRVTAAGEPVVMEEISVPAPTIGGAVESPDGGYESVLVDDGNGEEAAAIPAQSQDVPPDHGHGGTFDWLYSCVIEPSTTDSATAVPESLSWDSIAVSQTAGGYGSGMLCGRHGDHVCRDDYDDFCEPGGDCHGGCPPGSRWAIQAEALVLWRNNFEGQPLLLSNNGAVALDAGDVQTAAAAGPRIGVLHNIGCGRAIEGNYFNVGGIQGSTSTNGVGAPYSISGLTPLPFVEIEEAEYTTRGQIKSAELNYRWCQGRRIIWMAGFRWVEWNETAILDMQEASGADRGNNLQANVGNDLYGGQFGCRLKFWDLGKWQVGAVGKAGAFGNTAYQRTTAVVDGDHLGPVGANDDTVAFFGEVGINSTLWLNRWLAWRAGYNFFWLQGVATAAQQFPLTPGQFNTTTIVVNDAVFLQGFSTGLEARW